MIDLRRENYIAAAIAWCVIEDHPGFEKGQAVEQIQSSLYKIFHVGLDEELIEAALSILCEHGAVYPVSDEFTQQYYYFDVSETGNLVALMAENAESPFNKIQIFGYTWIREAVENIAKKSLSFSSNLTIETLSSVETVTSVPVEWETDVPASDRIVNINHNSPEYKQVTQEIDILEKQVRSDNTFGAKNFEERDAIIAELQAIREILKSDHVRTSFLKPFAAGTLVYLAEKFANGPIEAMAKALWESLLILFGIGV